MESPLVSILTPTYERHQFMIILARMIEHQQFDLSKVEWIVVDDSSVSMKEWFSTHTLNTQLYQLIYVHLSKKIPIGCKRNLTKTLAKGKYILHMDDDDYYSTNYVNAVVNIFEESKSAQIVGATTISLMFPNTLYLYETYPPKRNHSCGGILSYTQEYARTHDFLRGAIHAEEAQFLKGGHVVQIRNAHNVYMAFVHAHNTVSKQMVNRRPIPLRWIDVVQNAQVLRYYAAKHASFLPLREQLVRLQGAPKGLRTTIDRKRVRYGYLLFVLTIIETLIKMIKSVSCCAQAVTKHTELRKYNLSQ